MRWLLLSLLLLPLAGCGGISDYSPDSGSRTSLLGNQGGAGVQAPIWSNDPSHKTLTNQNGTP